MKNIRVLLPATVVIALAIVVSGCLKKDPMTAYIETIEEIQVAEKFEPISNDWTALYADFEVKFDEMSSEDLQNLKEENNVLINQLTDLITAVSNVEASDEKVKETNAFLVDSLNGYKNAMNEFSVILDAGVELKGIEADLTQPGVVEKLDAITVRLEKSADNSANFIQGAEKAITSWDALIKEAGQTP